MRARPLALAFGLVGCGDSVGVGDSGHDHTHGGGASGCEEPLDAYVAGIAKEGTGGLVTVTILSADPAPPEVGLNTLVVAVEPPTGGVPAVKPFMPMHGHGTTPLRFEGSDNGDGTWSYPDMDLFMPGLWEFTFEAEDDGGAVVDAAVFRFCVEG